MEPLAISCALSVDPEVLRQNDEAYPWRRLDTERAGVSLLRLIHVLVVLLVPPCTVVWYPLLRSSAFGNLALLDLVLATLWVTSLSLLLRRHWKTQRIRQCAAICVFALLTICASSLASLIFGNPQDLVGDFLRHMKGWGLASIIPLGMSLIPSARAHRLIAAVALLSTTFNVVIQFTAYQRDLPLFDEYSELKDVQDSRPTGAVSNPNDFAYISTMGFGFAAVLFFSRRRQTLLRAAVCLIGCALSVYGLLSSGSRSALIGTAAGAIYYITRRRIKASRKMALIGFSIMAVAIGWGQSSTFQERMSSAATDRLGELSFAGRNEAQTIALRTWLVWPLGVGYQNMASATEPYSGNAEFVSSVQGSDSIYVDTLLSSGIEGMACLLLCFGICWKVATAGPGAPGATILQAAILAMFICGFASVTPASSFVAPFFFSLVGLAAAMKAAQ